MAEEVAVKKTRSSCRRVAHRLCASVMGLMFLFTSSTVRAADRVGDEFLTGYVASVLEQDLHWERDSYSLKIVDGVAVITLFQEDPLRREAVDTQLRTIDGLRKITIRVRPADADRPGVVTRLTGLTGEGDAFPSGDLFRPLLADPKQPQFFVSAIRFKSPDDPYTMGAVGFGETYGLYRFLGRREGDGLQLNVEAGLFAQFNMDAPSSDLINADYTVGLPVTYRRGDHSLRFRFYHQSSHLGDEYIQSGLSPERVNLSYEAIGLIYAREWNEWRVYGGGEYLMAKEPEDLDPVSAHVGLEYRSGRPLFWTGRPIGGLDVKSFGEQDWALDTSVKAGFEFGHPNPGQRRVRVMAEWFKGYDPHGQFYNNKVEYYGLGLSLAF